jgi:hypothetical protein
MRQGHYLVTLLAESSGIDFATCDPEVAGRVRSWASRCLDAQNVWSRPRKVEASVEAVLRAIRDLRKKINSLDPSVLEIARATHAKANAAVGSEDGDYPSDKKLAVTEIFEWWWARLPSEQDLVDIAALHHLDNLERALVRPVEIAIRLTEGTPLGQGRPPELAARAVALTAARAVLDLTGKVPTYRRYGTPYAKLVESLFEFLFPGGNLDFERACKWALTKLPESG